MTIRQWIESCLTNHELRNEGLTATTITNWANHANADPPLRLDAVSSALAKMVKRGELEKLLGVGPRGGNGYRLPNRVNV